LVTPEIYSGDVNTFRIGFGEYRHERVTNDIRSPAGRDTGVIEKSDRETAGVIGHGEWAIREQNGQVIPVSPFLYLVKSNGTLGVVVVELQHEQLRLLDVVLPFQTGGTVERFRQFFFCFSFSERRRTEGNAVTRQQGHKPFQVILVNGMRTVADIFGYPVPVGFRLVPAPTYADVKFFHIYAPYIKNKTYIIVREL
jgi:hypothetical protein